MLRKATFYLFWLVLSLSIASPAAAETTVLAGEVSGTWSARGSPYRIEGDITVPAGQTLTIEPGVAVIFQSWYKLTVNGTLQATGSESQPILFTGIHPTAGWLGIRFIDASANSLLDHVIVEKGRATGASPEDSGGGLYIQNTDLTIRNSTIRNNYAKQNGGGLYLVGSDATLVGNTIVDNDAGLGSSAAGGGLFMIDANPQLTGNVIRHNHVTATSGYTPSTGAGGGIFARSSDPVLRGNIISDNSVSAATARGGGIFFYYAQPDLLNNTLANNTVGESAGFYSPKEGGGLYLYLSAPVIVNTILWNNTPQAIFNAQESIYNPITIAYSDLQGGLAAIVANGSTVNWLDGNIDADPLFMDSANGDFQLQAGSPALDAATAYFQWDGRVLVDLKPEDYLGAAPDMGALESGGAGSVNQPPVAVASADPDHGSAPLTVQFSGGGSSDPDGTIVAYVWAFGDGATSSTANPTHTYNDVGTYQAALTVTDDDGAATGAAVTVTVDPAAQDEIHVQSQTVIRQVRRRRSRAVDIVLVTDQSDQPVEGVLVNANYTGPNQGQVAGTTQSDGVAYLVTDVVRDAQGSWCFEITSVEKDGYAYDPGANVVTVQCEGNTAGAAETRTIEGVDAVIPRIEDVVTDDMLADQPHVYLPFIQH
jgi:parallel beta-helix repeat protein